MPSFEDTLRRLAHLPAADAVTALDMITQAIPTLGDPDRLDTIAQAMPSCVAELSGEVCQAVCQLAQMLAPYHLQLPDDLDELSPQLRIPWLRVQLVAGGPLPSADDLPAVFLEWSASAVVDPHSLFQKLAASADPATRTRLFSVLKPAITGLAITHQQAFALILPLLADHDLRVRRLAFKSPFAWPTHGLSHQDLARQENVLAAGLDEDFFIQQAALRAAQRLGRRDWLIDYLTDLARPESSRAIALIGLGPLAEKTDLDFIFQAAGPIALSSAIRTALLAAHRHGTFVRTHHLDALLVEFDQHQRWTADELVRITYVIRADLLTHLSALPADDPRWIRRAAILAVSSADEILSQLLAKTKAPQVAEAVLEAASRSSTFNGEAAIIAWLDRVPEAALRALQVKGTLASVAILQDLILVPGLGHTNRTLAIEVLWALTPDRAKTLTVLTRCLDRHPRWALKLPGTHSASLTADLFVEFPREELSEDELKVLCSSDNPRHLPRITSLFRALVSRCVQRALAGDFLAKRIELPNLEQPIFKYGRALINSGYVVRRWVADSPSTGRDLLLNLLTEWLAESPVRAITVALLEMIARHMPNGPTRRALEPYWRSGEREVQRAALEALIAAGEDARGLELSLSRLVNARSPRIAVRGLEAITEFTASWAEPMVIRALERPEMVVKKAAATALSKIGSPRATPKLLSWLARHDNQSFRSLLSAALSHSAGLSTAAVLVDAFEAETEPRSQALLLNALNNQLTRASILRLARSKRPCAAALIDAVLTDKITVLNTTSKQLSADLHRARLRVIETTVDPTEDIRVNGFSPAAAEVLLKAYAVRIDSRILKLISDIMAEWLQWCPSTAAATLALAAAGPRNARHLDALLALAPTVESSITIPFIKKCLKQFDSSQRILAIGILRTLPPSPKPGGWIRYQLLGQLDAVRSHSDLQFCLNECLIGPDVAQRTRELLFKALSIPKAKPNESASLTPLRKMAESWHRASPEARNRWLNQVIIERPLGCPAPATNWITERNKRPTRITELIAALNDPLICNQAAQVLLKQPDARFIWPQLLARHLTGELNILKSENALASVMNDWPQETKAHQRAMPLLRYLSHATTRRLIPQWLKQWQEGSPRAAECLQEVAQDLLFPFIWAQKAQDPTLVRLLSPSDPYDRRLLIDWLREHAPYEVARFEHPVKAPEPIVEIDPIEGQNADGLLALIAQSDIAHGLAVRAVHALTHHGPRGVDGLEILVIDRRPRIRSAALRALKTVAPRERTLEATASALHMETRRDVILSLMRSLGHGRHTPSLPKLIERLTARDPNIRDGARDAILAYGDQAVGTLRHAARRARPDRRPRYLEIIEALQDG